MTYLKMHETGVAVWSFNQQKFVPFVPTQRGEKRVRIDVFDGVENYAVYSARYTDETHFDLGGPRGKTAKPLTDWLIDLT